MGGIGRDPQRLPAGVEYFDFDMMEDESTPPRSVDEPATRLNTVRLLSGLLKPGGGAKTSVWGGGVQSVGGGLGLAPIAT